MSLICINFNKKRRRVMKNFFKSLLVILLFTVVFNTVSTQVSNATTVKGSQKSDLIVVRTQEGDKVYITIYTDNGIFVHKFEEL